MKISTVHFGVLWTAIKPLDTPERRAQYYAEGLSAKRYRWDLLYAAGLSPWMCANLYSYLNDDHIDTALRNIVKGV